MKSKGLPSSATRGGGSSTFSTDAGASVAAAAAAAASAVDGAIPTAPAWLYPRLVDVCGRASEASADEPLRLLANRLAAESAMLLSNGYANTATVVAAAEKGSGGASTTYLLPSSPSPSSSLSPSLPPPIAISGAAASSFSSSLSQVLAQQQQQPAAVLERAMCRYFYPPNDTRATQRFTIENPAVCARLAPFAVEALGVFALACPSARARMRHHQQKQRGHQDGECTEASSSSSPPPPPPTNWPLVPETQQMEALALLLQQDRLQRAEARALLARRAVTAAPAMPFISVGADGDVRAATALVFVFTFVENELRGVFPAGHALHGRWVLWAQLVVLQAAHAWLQREATCDGCCGAGSASSHSSHGTDDDGNDGKSRNGNSSSNNKTDGCCVAAEGLSGVLSPRQLYDALMSPPPAPPPGPTVTPGEVVDEKTGAASVAAQQQQQRQQQQQKEDCRASPPPPPGPLAWAAACVQEPCPPLPLAVCAALLELAAACVATVRHVALPLLRTTRLSSLSGGGADTLTADFCESFQEAVAAAVSAVEHRGVPTEHSDAQEEEEKDTKQEGGGGASLPSAVLMIAESFADILLCARQSRRSSVLAGSVSEELSRHNGTPAAWVSVSPPPLQGTQRTEQMIAWLATMLECNS